MEDNVKLDLWSRQLMLSQSTERKKSWHSQTRLVSLVEIFLKISQKLSSIFSFFSFSEKFWAIFQISSESSRFSPKITEWEI